MGTRVMHVPSSLTKFYIVAIVIGWIGVVRKQNETASLILLLSLIF